MRALRLSSARSSPLSASRFPLPIPRFQHPAPAPRTRTPHPHPAPAPRVHLPYSASRLSLSTSRPRTERINRGPLRVFLIEVLRFRAPVGEVGGPSAALIATGDICKPLNRRYEWMPDNRSAKRLSDCNTKGKNMYFGSRFAGDLTTTRSRGPISWRERLGAFCPRGRRQGANELLCCESLEKRTSPQLLCYNTILVCNERI